MWSKFIKILLILIPIILLILLFTLKGQLNKYLSKEFKSLTDTSTQNSIKAVVDSLYNYHLNNLSYQTTFLEFGAKGCVACRKMEFVLEEVKAEYPEKINVIFLNILHPQNQEMMKYFGVAAIPTQVLLDKSGAEYFRHTGYYSFKDLRKVMEKHLKY